MPRRAGPSVLPVAPPSRLLGARRRRGRGRPDHRARVPAADGGAGRLARRRLPRRGAARLDRLGRVARRRSRRSRRRSPSTTSTSRRPAASRSPTSENWVALVVFLIVAVVGSSVAQVARARRHRRPSSAAARPTSRRRWRGCCCAATSSRSRCPPPRSGSPAALDLPSAAIELAPVEGDERRVAFPLREGTTPARHAAACRPGCPRRRCGALQERVVPQPRGAARGRRSSATALLGEVVETRALRRADVVKTALLRVGLARPAHAADRDRRGRRGARLADARRTRSGASSAAASPPRARGCRASSTTCSTSRGSRAAPPSRGPSGARSRRCIDAAVDDLRAAGRALLARRSTATCRSCARTPRSSSARSRTCSRTPRATRAGTRSSVRARVTGGRLLVIRVVDRGPGIPPAQRERVFEPFYRAGSASAGHRGSGLGLAIVRGFVEANGGTVVGRVAARARARRSSSSSRPSCRVPAPTSTRPHVSPRRRVLVCDDEPQILRALRVVLRDAGFEVDPGRRPRRRRSTTRRCARRDAAIIDLVLPDGDGIEVCRAAARVDDDADHRALRGRRGGAEGPRAGGRRRRLRHQAVRPARARRAPAGGAAARGARRRTSRCCAPTASSSTSPRTRVRRDGEEVHLTPIEFELLSVLARNRGRLMTHRALLDRGLGPGLRRRHRDAAHPHRQPAPQDRAAGGQRRYIRTDPASATASRLRLTRCRRALA